MYKESSCSLSYSSHNYYDWLCERNHWPHIHFMSSFLLYYTTRDALLVVLVAYVYESFELAMHYARNEHEFLDIFEIPGNMLHSDILASVSACITGYAWTHIWRRWEERFAPNDYPECRTWAWSKGSLWRRLCVYALVLALILPNFRTYGTDEGVNIFSTTVIWITLGQFAASLVVEWPLLLFRDQRVFPTLAQASAYFAPRSVFILLLGMSNLYIWTYALFQVWLHALGLCLLAWVLMALATASYVPSKQLYRKLNVQFIIQKPR